MLLGKHEPGTAPGGEGGGRGFAGLVPRDVRGRGGQSVAVTRR